MREDIAPGRSTTEAPATPPGSTGPPSLPPGRRIGYTEEWLRRYDRQLPEEDERLKAREAALVADVLRSRDRWGRIGSYLDIGTCTGRYPLLLGDAVLPGGTIVGIDQNRDCVLTARANLARHRPDEDRISILWGDFSAPDLAVPGAPFDLITCMMSTVSHFNGGAGREGGIPRMLERCARLLADHGLLLLSSWSEEACRARDFLSIYGADDAVSLARWTPSPEELGRSLAAAGFTDSTSERPDPRLDLWVCTGVRA